MLNSFPREKVKIVRNGIVVSDNVNAIVESDLIIIDDATIDIEEGDYISRELPGGRTEQYFVLDTGFQRRFGSFPDHYQVKVEKTTVIPKTSRPAVVNNYHIQTADKVNINTTDNSVTYNMTTDEKAIFEVLKGLAKGLENEADVKLNIQEMEETAGQKGFAGKYNAFIQSVAAHMTIFSPFIPMLTDILAKSIN